MVKRSARPEWPGAPTYQVFELIRLIRRTAAEAFREDRLGIQHVLVLDRVAAHGPLSQREISDRLRVDPADMVGVVDLLEERGLVDRRRDPADRRRYQVEATEAGRRYLERHREVADRMNRALFEPLAAHELDSFTEMIERVLAHHDPRFRCDPTDDRPGC